MISIGQLLLFFAIFFTLIGGFFAVHLAVFVAITPSPDSGVAPWNFGGYAYPNYPNSKTGQFCLCLCVYMQLYTQNCQSSRRSLMLEEMLLICI